MRKTPVEDYLEEISTTLPEEAYGRLSDAIYETNVDFDQEIESRVAENAMVRKQWELITAMWTHVYARYYNGEITYEDYASISDSMQELRVGVSNEAKTSEELTFLADNSEVVRIKNENNNLRAARDMAVEDAKSIVVMLSNKRAENAKLRELVRDMYKAFMHGNCYRWCEFKDPCNYISDGKCQWYDRMRELGVEVDE